MPRTIPAAPRTVTAALRTAPASPRFTPCFAQTGPGHIRHVPRRSVVRPWHCRHRTNHPVQPRSSRRHNGDTAATLRSSRLFPVLLRTDYGCADSPGPSRSCHGLATDHPDFYSGNPQCGIMDNIPTGKQHGDGRRRRGTQQQVGYWLVNCIYQVILMNVLEI